MKQKLQNAENEHLEIALLKWFTHKRTVAVSVNRLIIKANVNDFKECLNTENFQCSVGQLHHSKSKEDTDNTWEESATVNKQFTIHLA